MRVGVVTAACTCGVCVSVAFPDLIITVNGSQLIISPKHRILHSRLGTTIQRDNIKQISYIYGMFSKFSVSITVRFLYMEFST